MLDIDPEHQFKVPVVRRHEYTLYLEQATPSMTFIHCAVHVPWSRDVKERLANDWETLLSLHGGPIYCIHSPEDRKHEKFVAMFGFQKVGEFVSAADGQTYHIMIT